ncbi:hypothetical protein COMA2_10392 [Candidatus Nitrospira nitrificans]|uniref:Uncharacterized protein n=1 Tax=Candidatus Nitrospira nitrificans TaxID=1742973 RepID=A0A0S4L382_9BACT|nr:hypothetical protein COMA2_10392 [Candidatus Nitrospira nitrificans]
MRRLLGFRHDRHIRQLHRRRFFWFVLGTDVAACWSIRRQLNIFHDIAHQIIRRLCGSHWWRNRRGGHRRKRRGRFHRRSEFRRFNRFRLFNGFGWRNGFRALDGLRLLYRLGLFYLFLNRRTFLRVNGLFRKRRQTREGNLNRRQRPFTMPWQSNPAHYHQYADMKDQRDDDGKAQATSQSRLPFIIRNHAG